MKDIYAALLLSLARKKYVELIKVNNNNNNKGWSSENTKIVIKYKPSEIPFNAEELSPNEKEYLNLLLRHCSCDEITLSNLQNKISNDYTRTETFVENLKNSKKTIGINQGYYQKVNYTEVRDLLIFNKTVAITRVCHLKMIKSRIQKSCFY